MGSHFASKTEPSSLELVASKNIRHRRNSRSFGRTKSCFYFLRFRSRNRRTLAFAKRMQAMGSHFASKTEPSSLGLVASKNIRHRRNSRALCRQIKIFGKFFVLLFFKKVAKNLKNKLTPKRVSLSAESDEGYAPSTAQVF